MTYAVRSIYEDGLSVWTPAASTEEALVEARRLVETRRSKLVSVSVAEWAGGETCVWHRDWTDEENNDRLNKERKP
jgi:hypothetical protein